MGRVIWTATALAIALTLPLSAAAGDEAKELFIKGRDHYGAGRYQEALHHFQRCRRARRCT